MDALTIEELHAVPCPRCGARAGELCRRLTTAAVTGRTTMRGGHLERLETAHAARRAAETRARIDRAANQRELAFHAGLELGLVFAEYGTLNDPHVVLAVAEVMKVTGHPAMAQGLIESEQDARPDEWAAHARWELAARSAQHDEDEAREAQL